MYYRCIAECLGGCPFNCSKYCFFTQTAPAIHCQSCNASTWLSAFVLPQFLRFHGHGLCRGLSARPSKNPLINMKYMSQKNKEYHNLASNFTWQTTSQVTSLDKRRGNLTSSLTSRFSCQVSCEVACEIIRNKLATNKLQRQTRKFHV